jgi:hypothetical protein
MPINSALPTLTGAKALAAVVLVGVCVSGCAQSSRFGADTWREEVLLHDGQRVVVERSQTYGGRHEIGQAVPAKEHTIRFTLTNSSNVLAWTSEYGEELGRTNFNLLALHIRDNTPYLVAEPNLCLSYNKWGRPNPPYVFFKHDGTVWHRVAIEDVPTELKTINLIVNTSRLAEIQKSSRSTGYVPFEAVAKINEELRQPELKSILREPVRGGIPGCEELVRYKCGWGAPGEFNRKYFESACK